jgi:hypothetical protein
MKTVELSAIVALIGAVMPLLAILVKTVGEKILFRFSTRQISRETPAELTARDQREQELRPARATI